MFRLHVAETEHKKTQKGIGIEKITVPEKEVVVDHPKQNQPQDAPEVGIGHRFGGDGLGRPAGEKNDPGPKHHGEHAPHGAFEKQIGDPPDLQVPSGGPAGIGGIAVGPEQAKPVDVHQKDAQQGATPDNIKRIDSLGEGGGRKGGGFCHVMYVDKVNPGRPEAFEKQY